MKMKNYEIKKSKFFEIKKQLNFQWKFRWKISRFFDLKIFGRPISKCSNFFRNKPFWSSFFSKLCRFPRRTRWKLFPGCYAALSVMMGHEKVTTAPQWGLYFARFFIGFAEASGGDICSQTSKNCKKIPPGANQLLLIREVHDMNLIPYDFRKEIRQGPYSSIIQPVITALTPAAPQPDSWPDSANCVKFMKNATKPP